MADMSFDNVSLGTCRDNPRTHFEVQYKHKSPHHHASHLPTIPSGLKEKDHHAGLLAKGKKKDHDMLKFSH